MLIVAREISGPQVALSDSPMIFVYFFKIFLALFFIVIHVCLVTSCAHIVGGTSKNDLQLCKPFLDLHAVQASSLMNCSGWVGGGRDFNI